MEERHGLLFADVSGTAGPLDDHLGDLTPHLEHYRLGELERAGAITYDVEANWKAIVENYSECLHCPGVHPELNRLSPLHERRGVRGRRRLVRRLDDAQRGRRDDGRRTAATASARRSRGLTEKEQRDVLYFALFPNLLV